MTERIDRQLDRISVAKTQRASWDAHWQALAEMFSPFDAVFSGEREEGFRGTEDLYDGTPLQAVRGLASAVDWLLKPKEEDWFSIEPEDIELKEVDRVNEWLELGEKRLYGALYTPAAGFQLATGDTDEGLVVMGTAPLYFDLSPSRTSFRFVSCGLRDCYIMTNVAGQVDTMYRRLRWTVRQAAQQFGPDKLSPDLRKLLDKDHASDRDKKFTFWHATMPRRELELDRREAPGMDIGSIYFEEETKHELSVRGYRSFPFIVPRWQVKSGEAYGRSPGMLGLPDARTLNDMSYTNLRQGQFAAQPPLFVPNETAFMAGDLVPGGIVTYDVAMAEKMGGQIPVREMQTGSGLTIGLEMENQRRDMVWGAFLRNVLQLPVEGPQMTATEIRQRREEFIRMVGPPFGRLESEYTAPIVERGFNMLLELGLLPPPPPELAGRNVVFRYQSPVKRVRELIEVSALGETVAQLGPLVELKPGILDYLDEDAIARDVPVYNGVPAKWLLSKEQVAAKRQVRDAAIAQQQQQQAALELAKVAPSATKAAADIGLIPGSQRAA